LTVSCGDTLADHDWEPLDPARVEATYIVTDDGHDVPIPLADTPLPTLQCRLCGTVAVPRL
jgi:hypothetical protein